jgi:hypothetical protein
MQTYLTKTAPLGVFHLLAKPNQGFSCTHSSILGVLDTAKP